MNNLFFQLFKRPTSPSSSFPFAKELPTAAAAATEDDAFEGTYLLLQLLGWAMFGVASVVQSCAKEVVRTSHKGKGEKFCFALLNEVGY